ncbi:MAG: NusA-like transcription termination signal-binding factor [Methanobacteriota archaeon]
MAADEVVLDQEAMRTIVLFERETRTRIKDAHFSDERVVFVVPEDLVGKAIGRGAMNLKRLREALKKEIDIVGFSDDPKKFVENLFHRYGLEEVRLDERKDGARIAHVRVKASDKGKAIGRNGRNIQTALLLAKRNAGIAEIVLE